MLRLIGLATGTVALGLTGLYGIHLGATHGRVLREFEDLAANQYYHVLAEPLRVRPGMDARASGVAGRLSRAGLQRVRRDPAPGECSIGADVITYHRAEQPQNVVQIELNGNLVAAIRIDDASVDGVDLPAEHLTSFRESMRERRAPVDFAALPPTLVTAVLAAEDRRFFDHKGLDWRGIMRALARNAAHRRVVEGGSTITQQTVKIILHRTRRELPAKVDEAMLALWVERRFTKQQILQVYLNNVYLGHEGPFNIHGVVEGARFFFGKPLLELTDEEMIELAAAIRAPNAASPRRHRERLASYTKAIAKAVPDVSAPDASPLDESEVLDAKPTAVEAAALTADRMDFETSQLAYYLDILEREWEDLRKKHRIEPPATIIATVDPVLQLRAAQGLQRGLDAAAKRKPRAKDAAPLQGAVAAVDPASGALRAVVGGRDYVQAPFNRAWSMSRQVGSTFKPFVYLAAFGTEADTQLTQSSQLPDELREYRVGKQVWAPANSDGQFRGQVTARLALEQSINTATVALGMQVGVENVARLAEQLGIQDQVAENPSMLLGAVETSPVRLAGAYACFANGGYRVTPHALSRVQVGDEEFRPERPQPRRMVSSAGAYLVTDMLVGALQHGTGASAARLGFHHLAAGKTGTSDQARDTWFVGYTPDLATAVWVGNDDNSPTGMSGASAALPVWVATMSPWLGGGVDTQFDIPPGIDFRSIDPITGGLANSTCPDVEPAAYMEGSEPQEYCSLHSPSFSDRWDRLFGDDEAPRPDDGASQRQGRGLWNRLKSALGG